MMLLQVKKKTPVNELPLEYRRVLALIREGSDNPTRVSEISKLTGYGDTFVRSLVNKLIITHGYAIGTSNRMGNSGYYICTNDDERYDTIRNLEGRSLQIQKRADALKSISL